MTQYAVTPLGHTLKIPEQRKSERRALDHYSAQLALAQAQERIRVLESALSGFLLGPTSATYKAAEPTNAAERGEANKAATASSGAGSADSQSSGVLPNKLDSAPAAPSPEAIESGSASSDFGLTDGVLAEIEEEAGASNKYYATWRDGILKVVRGHINAAWQELRSTTGKPETAPSPAPAAPSDMEWVGGIVCTYANWIEESFGQSNPEIPILLTNFARELIKEEWGEPTRVADGWTSDPPDAGSLPPAEKT